MLEKIKSEGKCCFCGKTFTKAGINRHLKTHLQQKTNENKTGKSYLVKIEDNFWDSSDGYFLSLWVNGEATLYDIDTLLRKIWLECCGHKSVFINKERRTPNLQEILDLCTLKIEGKIDEFEQRTTELIGPISIDTEVGQLFYKGLRIEYKYDPGDLTDLLLTVMEEYPIHADSDIVLLSRNEPLNFYCCSCNKEPATTICTVHDWGENHFCPKCAKEHAKTCSDFEEHAARPIVNSPRTGCCVYNGGTIDKERDGVFHLNIENRP